jgi:type IV pilus assembly protein PilA
MKKSNKKGFTLIELMVVAIIVAVLAAVAIPLMSGNKRRAAATEGQAGCSTIATAVRAYYAEHNALPAAGGGTTLPGIMATDLEGAYFADTSYAYAPTGTRGFTVTATADARNATYSGGTVIMTVAENQTVGWTGTLLQ